MKFIYKTCNKILIQSNSCIIVLFVCQIYTERRHITSIHWECWTWLEVTQQHSKKPQYTNCIISQVIWVIALIVCFGVWPIVCITITIPINNLLLPSLAMRSLKKAQGYWLVWFSTIIFHYSSKVRFFMWFFSCPKVKLNENGWRYLCEGYLSKAEKTDGKVICEATSSTSPGDIIYGGDIMMLSPATRTNIPCFSHCAPK